MKNLVVFCSLAKPTDVGARRECGLCGEEVWFDEEKNKAQFEMIKKSKVEGKTKKVVFVCTACASELGRVFFTQVIVPHIQQEHSHEHRAPFSA